MADRRLVLGLATVLALAGCTATGVPAEPALTVTPAPVPTDPEPTPVYRVAPGVDTEGVVDPLALAGAHAAVLASTSYRVAVVEHVETLDGRLVEHRVVLGTVEGPTQYRLDLTRRTHRGPDPASSLYANGAALYERLVTTDGTRYYVPRASLDGEAPWPEDPVGSPTHREELYVGMAGSDPGYAGAVVVDGTTYHRLVATRATHPAFLAAWEYVGSIEAYGFSALVRKEGLVRSYEVRYVAVAGGERRLVTRTARWSAVGGATVRPPDWYAAVLSWSGD